MRISDWSSDVCSSDLFIRWFHRPARHIMVATPSLRQELADQGLEQTMLWERGVDHALFRPDRAPHPAFADLPRPIQLYVGRVAVEKNIEAFLDASHPGTKVIVGDGPGTPRTAGTAARQSAPRS